MEDVGIIGLGWVGRAVHDLFPQARIHDPAQGYHDLCALNSKIIFVAVPTPCMDEGVLDCSIVESVIRNCNQRSLIVIRSTVQPGFADKMTAEGWRICVQPEYLGETVAHPLLDETKRNFLIIGGSPRDRRELINLYQSTYNANIHISQVTNKEAEIIKLSENRAIAFKVAQCQELYDVCEAAGVDYYIIREAVYGDDPRFTLWFSFVFPENRGFNSRCIPKDVYAWCAWAESLGYNPRVTREILEKNKEWICLQ